MTWHPAIVEWLHDSLRRSALACAAGALALGVSFAGGAGWPIDPAWIAIILCGVPILWESAVGLFIRHDIKADVLVSLAMIASIALGEYQAAGIVVLIMALGGLLEEASAAKSRQGLARLAARCPQTARVIRGGREQMVSVAEVAVGETVRVFADETVPLDGNVLNGTPALNQAAVTGESLPVDKVPGDAVFSGTVDESGTFDLQVTRRSEDSAFQRMVAMVGAAGTAKTRAVRLADRCATYLVLAVLALTVGVYAVTGDAVRAVTVMVVFCPCAFILATPTAVVAAIGNLAGHQVLVRDGEALERLAAVDRAAFDKTGTLTVGAPAVRAVLPAAGVSAAELLAAAAAAECQSTHPLARAVMAAAAAAGVAAVAPETCRTISGQGIIATAAKQEILCGGRRLLMEHQVDVPAEADLQATACSAEGASIAYVAVDGRYLGLLSFADRLRPEAVAAVQELTAEGVGSVLLTGDNARAAAAVARQTGLTEVVAECTPADKLAAVQRLQAAGHRVCMVGDGLNDAPALREAWVGIALGRDGQGLAADAADLVLIGDDLAKLAYVRRLARRMMLTIKGTITFSLVWNAAAVTLAVDGLIGPVAGALIHNVGSVAVVVCAAMLLFYGRRSGLPAASGSNAEHLQR